MMKYRPYIQEDYERVFELCKQHKIQFPFDNNFLLVAEDNEGDIVSIAGLKQMWFVEPLIGSNSLANNNLFRMIEGVALGHGIKKLYAIIPENNKQHINHAKKEGFEIIVETNKVIMEKDYNGTD